MEQLMVYDAPKGAVATDDFMVSVRVPGGEWQELFVYEAKVDMHNVRRASMVYFDMEGTVEVAILSKHLVVEQVAIRPLSYEIPFEQQGNGIIFKLDRPRKLAIEVNGERFANLHVFANKIEQAPPQPSDPNVLVLKPAIHRTEDIYRLAATPNETNGKAPDTIYFAPGMHFLEETLLRIPSGTTVYVAGGAVVAGSFLCDNVKNVTIRGRGIVYLSDFHRFSAFRGVRIVFSNEIRVEGIITLDPPHYSIYIGKSQNIHIENFKSFSTRGWSDGIDMMASENIVIDDVFLRTSDDSIAIYGTRWDFVGDTRNVTVRNSTFWADVAHPLMIGTHGDYHKNGDTIENIVFDNIDILEHHEPQPNYWGAMAINAGDKNTVRNVKYSNIRVEDFELGQLFDIRVVWNKDYNPVAGNRIESVEFRDITYNGRNENPSRIYGFDEERIAADIRFINVRINDKLVTDAESGNFDLNDFVKDVSFS
ncbi:glycosyl hydrolase family 28 protein [Paenibacillus sp. YIM B09110]|uniref:glycosyl hydrolase family 28 protein n=1 Tax=Paenibacillus sp. YIM B09110 TaxID=3126102 RepID=UPI00301C0219